MAERPKNLKYFIIVRNHFSGKAILTHEKQF